jgi:hypothetical protein
MVGIAQPGEGTAGLRSSSTSRRSARHRQSPAIVADRQRRQRCAARRVAAGAVIDMAGVGIDEERRAPGETLEKAIQPPCRATRSLQRRYPQRAAGGAAHVLAKVRRADSRTTILAVLEQAHAVAVQAVPRRMHPVVTDAADARVTDGNTAACAVAPQALRASACSTGVCLRPIQLRPSPSQHTNTLRRDMSSNLPCAAPPRW